MPDSRLTKAEKKTYTKPVVTEVRLVAEEAVLANCMNATGGRAACQAKGQLSCVPGFTQAS